MRNAHWPCRSFRPQWSRPRIAAVLVALATLLFAASTAAVPFPDRGSFAFGVVDDGGESGIVRHHGGEVRLEHDGRAEVVILLLPAEGVMV